MMNEIEITYHDNQVDVVFPNSCIGQTFRIFILNKYSQESHINQVVTLKEDNLHIIIPIRVSYAFAKNIFPLEVNIYDFKYNLIREFVYDDYLLGDGINLSNDDNSAYVLYCNEKYADVIVYLIQSLMRVSKKKIILYEINCYIKIDNDQVIKRHIHVPNTLHEMFYIKPFIMVTAFKDFNFNYLCFIDSDVIVNNNIDDIWEYSKYKLEYPLFSKGIYEYTNFYDHPCPHPYFDIKYDISFENKYTPYITTNLFLCNRRHINFIKEWYLISKDVDNRDIIEEYKQTTDETLANVMLYRFNAKVVLPLYFINCWTYDDFYWVMNGFKPDMDLQLDGISYYPKIGIENGEGYSRVHINKKMTVGYHLIKDVEYAKKVLDYLNKE